MKQRLKEELAQSFAEIEVMAECKVDCVKISEKAYLNYVRREAKNRMHNGKKNS